ncbi:hypothetical protein L202_07857 [Cryptococcus amylolentus CBS 6039]|uniref:RRM domain-containing protein n=2 Tax=Cryptococcus amylolentus TaxID=104669 RepID=A0A1E3HCY6_9TREE|nr:hypothetical protein L202_07857 [Cryptococcus amylolentus CBS 6039]ODN73311.1 hypothetical protein L202_07857 [Cryptococcus amylolentus CBS 6039]ODN99111.1 hypothetical protein I350_07266 [Cryptococcus amylolentus CBS 6273]
MSYASYNTPYGASNSYYSAPAAPAQRPRAAPAAPAEEPHRVLFAGLPNDITANELRDLIISKPLSLPALTTTVTFLHGEDGAFFNAALVHVNSWEEAEKIREEYNGRDIDGVYILQVHHILPSYISLPLSSNVSIPSGPKAMQAPAARPQPPAGPAVQQNAKRKAGQQQQNGKAKAGQSNQPPGAALLSRISGKNGKPAPTPVAGKKAKAAAQNKSSGDNLLARLGSAPGQAPKSKKNKNGNGKAANNGAAKVNRAKGKASGMDVD